MENKYAINKEKISQAQKYLCNLDIDCWLILTKEGSDPATPLMFGLSIVGDAALLITEEKVIAICSSIDDQDIEESGLFNEVIKYSDSFSNSLKQVIEEDLKPEKIAINYSEKNHLADGLTVGKYRKLLKTLDAKYHGRLISSECFLPKIRSIKSPLEITYIQKAIDITLDIYDEVFSQLKKGMSEKEIGQLFIDGMIKRNVVNGISRKLTMPIVMKHNIAHRSPGDAVLEEGDYLIFDFSVDYKGYCSDIARTCYVLKDGETEASFKMQKAFATIYEAISKAKSILKPGVKGYEVDSVARNHIIKNGFPDIFHAVGHQIGRDVHDGGTLLGPRWERYGTAPYLEVEEGMVFTLEPTILIEEGPAIISEDNLLVTSSGCEFLSKRQEELVLIK